MDTRQAAPRGRQFVFHEPPKRNVDIEMQDANKTANEVAERERLRQRLLRLIVKNESRRVAPLSRPPQGRD
jgi:hypothetical protein